MTYVTMSWISPVVNGVERSASRSGCFIPLRIEASDVQPIVHGYTEETTVYINVE